MVEGKKEHLFISYATEDEALTEWLARKLSLEGYKVWCDRFKLLGGESYPKDIDDAIKHRTFRVIALLSRASIGKPNPVKERTLAVNISRERKIDFLIPLNVDGLSATELDWHTSDLTYISFNNGWADGLRSLLKKLESIDAPKKHKKGVELARATYAPENIVKNRSEKIVSNCISFKRIPDKLFKYVTSQDVYWYERDNISKGWPNYQISPRKFLSFAKPPSNIVENFKLLADGVFNWRKLGKIEGIVTSNIVSHLLKRSLIEKCLSLGLKQTGCKRRRVYFPYGLLEREKIRFVDIEGKKRWVCVAGTRKHYVVGNSAERYRYHLAPSFFIKQNTLGEDFIAELKIELHLTGLNGEEIPARGINSRRKNICKSWWNNHWCNRLMAILYYLSGDGMKIVLSSDEQLILNSKPFMYKAPVSIDEKALSPSANLAGLTDSKSEEDESEPIEVAVDE